MDSGEELECRDAMESGEELECRNVEETPAAVLSSGHSGPGPAMDLSGHGGRRDSAGSGFGERLEDLLDPIYRQLDYSAQLRESSDADDVEEDTTQLLRLPSTDQSEEEELDCRFETSQDSVQSSVHSSLLSAGRLRTQGESEEGMFSSWGICITWWVIGGG